MKKILLGLFSVLLVLQAVVEACDVCGCYTSTKHEAVSTGPYIGVFEQFSHFSTLQNGGQNIGNPLGQYLDSSITQLIVGQRFGEHFSLQLNAPYIHRAFRRATSSGGVEDGREEGVGDISLLGGLHFRREGKKDGLLLVNIIGGVKFPTGSTNRLLEEVAEHTGGGGEEEEEPITNMSNGIHGHDLALGSGSTDGIVGVNVFLRCRRFFAAAAFQYVIRTEGDYGYRYANELTWNGGPGVYLWASDAGSLGLQFNVSGETKGNDSFQGMPATDTSVTSVYLGPEIVLVIKERLSVDVGVDIPVMQHNTLLQLMPDYRIRAAATLRF